MRAYIFTFIYIHICVYVNIYVYIHIHIYIYGMPLNSPCWDFVTRWIGGACPPTWNGLWLPIGVQELPNWVLGSAHGLRASAWALGAGTKALPLVPDRGAGIGRRPNFLIRPALPGMTTWGQFVVSLLSIHVVGFVALSMYEDCSGTALFKSDNRRCELKKTVAVAFFS